MFYEHSKKNRISAIIVVFIIISAFTYFITNNNNGISTSAYDEKIIIYDEQVPLSPIYDSDGPGTFSISTYTESPEDLVTEETFEAYQMQMLNLVNESRKQFGLDPLVLNTSLCNSSIVRSNEIEINFSHTRPNGEYFNTAIYELNTIYNGCGENVAYGFRTVEDVFNAWMNSEGHRNNILNPKFKYFGAGYHKGNNKYDYWAQHFAY